MALRIICLSMLIWEMEAKFRNKKLTRKLADIKPGQNMFQDVKMLQQIRSD